MGTSIRLKQLDKLSQFIVESKIRADCILQSLEWEESSTLKIRKERIVSDRKDEIEPFSISQSNKHSVTLDSNTIGNILKNSADQIATEKRSAISNTFDDLQRNFNRAEKLAIYVHCVQQTGRLSEPEITVMINESKGSKKEMTFAEIVAQKRNLKRRSLKYRTTKEPPLSQTEELRNLIDLQMGALSQYLNPNKDRKVDAVSRLSIDHSKNRLRTNRSRSRSRPRRSRSHSKHKVKHKSKDRKR